LLVKTPLTFKLGRGVKSSADGKSRMEMLKTEMVEKIWMEEYIEGGITGVVISWSR
jgi:hypothetical protein